MSIRGWEQIENVELLWRIEVEGGWLYRTAASGVSTSLCFVPHEPVVEVRSKTVYRSAVASRPLIDRVSSRAGRVLAETGYASTATPLDRLQVRFDALLYELDEEGR